jgi:hypothetical protein
MGTWLDDSSIVRNRTRTYSSSHHWPSCTQQVWFHNIRYVMQLDSMAVYLVTVRAQSSFSQCIHHLTAKLISSYGHAGRLLPADKSRRYPVRRSYQDLKDQCRKPEPAACRPAGDNRMGLLARWREMKAVHVGLSGMMDPLQRDLW